jgi:hypothetical protein
MRRRVSRNGPNPAEIAAELRSKYSERARAPKRWNNVMNNSNGTFGLIVGGVFAMIAAMFILSGGELGGKKTVQGDQDLPPVATSGNE